MRLCWLASRFSLNIDKEMDEVVHKMSKDMKAIICENLEKALKLKTTHTEWRGL